MSPKDWAQGSPPSHSQGRGSSFSQSFHSHHCLPIHQRPSTLGAWHGPLPILPGVASARGAFPPSCGHSGMRHQLDTNLNLAGKASSGRPQGLLRLRPQQALLENLIWDISKYQGPVGLFHPYPCWLICVDLCLFLPPMPPNAFRKMHREAIEGPHPKWRYGRLS